MRRRLTTLTVTSLSLVAVVAGLGVSSAAAARRPHCTLVPVPGQVATFVAVCSTARA